MMLPLMALTSCRVKEIPDTGTLELRMSDLGDFITVDTKATDYSDFSNYDVVIDGPTKLKAKFSTLSGQVVELGSGSYAITVTSPNTEPAAFEQPIYQAKEEFEIKAGEVTPLDLTCTPLNCKVTINLSDNFKKELAAYEVVIGNGLGELVWTKNAEKNDFSDEKAGYFLPRGLEIKVKGYRSIDNTEATAVYFIKDPQPADHHVVNLDAKVTGQIGGIKIDVDTDFNERNEDVNVDGMDEVYVDRPDFDDDDDNDDPQPVLKNSIVWQGNETFAPVTLTAETTLQMAITMPAGIASFVVEVSDNFKPLVAVITTGGVQYLDLINDNKIIENELLASLATGEELLNQTEVLFDLTGFVEMLLALQGEEDMTVEFILKATDNNGDDLLFMDDYPVVTMIIPKASGLN